MIMRPKVTRSTVKRPKEGPFFVVRHLLRWGLAEILNQLGNLAPGPLGRSCWRLALVLNGHHEGAAINLATQLAETADADAWQAFERCLQQLQNEHGISASDLHLSRWPGRLARRLAARRLWGGLAEAHPQEAVHDAHHAVLRAALQQLARHHCRNAMAYRDLPRAGQAFEVWRSLAGDDIEVRWMAVEMSWLEGSSENAAPYLPHLDANLQNLLRREAFVSPLDTLLWGERLLTLGALDDAAVCFGAARRLLPEEADTWHGAGRLAMAQGSTQEARHCWQRALSRNPQDEATFLDLLALDAPAVTTPGPGTLTIEGPSRLELDAEGPLTVRLEGVEAPQRYTLHLLPPAGWGLIAHPRQAKFDDYGEATVRLVGRRPHRLLGRPWTLVALAVGPEGHHRAELSTEVVEPASKAGRILLTVTEDHEIHEERGLFTPEQMHRVLVEKSRLAANLGVPWTHMVEVGSVLNMVPTGAPAGAWHLKSDSRAGAWHPPDGVQKTGAWHQDQAHPAGAWHPKDDFPAGAWHPPKGPQKTGAWHRLWTAIRRHLAEEVAKGHDLQPHLHAFNDPTYSNFPYRFDADGWRPSYSFLLTDAQRRGDFASVCPPPGHPTPLARGWDRLRSVERAVAQLEAVGRLGDASYRPLLWRSGLLEYGLDEVDRSWSSVALRRAGLKADSDVVRPPSSSGVPIAFMARGSRPFVPETSGSLLQLPIAANLEGGYLQGERRLRRLARRCCDAVRQRPGVHLFTLLTHDKFINARRGRDEYRDDPDYGDWPVIRRHLADWQAAGAEVVTASEGVQRVLDDRSWHLQAVLRQETFVADLSFLVDGQSQGESSETDVLRVRYRLQWLGHGIEVSAEYPQQVWVSLPCSWRDHVHQVSLRQGEQALPTTDMDRHGFWLEVEQLETPVDCTLALDDALRPLRIERLSIERLEKHGKGADESGATGHGATGAWHLRLRAEQPFLAARLLIPWHDGFPPLAAIACRPLDDTPASGGPLPEACIEHEGLLLTGLAFAEDDDGNIAPLDVLLVEVT